MEGWNDVKIIGFGTKCIIFALVFLLFSQNIWASSDLLAFETPFPTSRYKKALNCCMQVWGDVCVLRDRQEVTQERLLLIDAVLGRMTFMDAAINEMLAQEAVAQPGDRDISYLSQLLARVEMCCDQIAAWDGNERVKCFKPLIKGMQNKLMK